MPRAHTEEEVARIRRNLLEKGRARFERQGLLRTTIAELCEDASIGKGSFYKFYPSKEELFVAISHLEERRFRQDLLDDLAGDSHRKLVLGLLEAPSRRLREHPFLRSLLDPETIAELNLRLGSKRMRADQESDREFFIDLARRWKKMGILNKSVAPEDVFAALSGLFLVELGRPLMHETDIDRSLTTMRNALVDAWVVEGPGR